MATRKYVVEFIQAPLATGSFGCETVACVETFAELQEFFLAEFPLVDPALQNELADLIESPETDMTDHYRISVTHGKRAKVFVDQ